MGDAYMQGEIWKEAARVCIEAGPFQRALQLHEEGTKAGLADEGIWPGRIAPSKFRLAHAYARLTLREGKKQQAWQSAAQAKQILDRNAEMAKQRAIFYPY